MAIITLLRSWLNWIEYSATNRAVAGSNPAERTNI
jgi:hypothetical protein